MSHEKRQGLLVGQVSLFSPDFPLEVSRISSFLQQLLLIIGLQKGRMALAEMANDVFTGSPDISEHPHVRALAGDEKTMRVASVMPLGESRDAEFPDPDGFITPQGEERESPSQQSGVM